MVGGSGRVDSYSYDENNTSGRAAQMDSSEGGRDDGGYYNGSENFCSFHGDHYHKMNEEKVHKVCIPETKSMAHQFASKMKETFFPDDPFRQFKGKPLGRKWVLGLQYVFPILEWAPKYKLNLFKSDIISGLTIASLAIPQVILPTFQIHDVFFFHIDIHKANSMDILQGISYAKLASLPPIVGLCGYFINHIPS